MKKHREETSGESSSRGHCEEVSGEGSSRADSPGFTSPATQLWPRASSKGTCKGRKLSLLVLFLCSGSETGQNRLPTRQPKTQFTHAPPTPVHGNMCTRALLRDSTGKHDPDSHHHSYPPGSAPDLESRNQEDSGPRPLPTHPHSLPSTSPGWSPGAVSPPGVAFWFGLKALSQ